MAKGNNIHDEVKEQRMKSLHFPERLNTSGATTKFLLLAFCLPYFLQVPLLILL